MFKPFLGAVLAITLLAGNANASTIALQWTNSGTEGSSNQTRGWAFSSNTAINISSLGWFDAGNDGLVSSHQVGIWDASGNLLMSGTVGSGETDPLLAGFRYTSALMGTTVLAAGNYVVAGLSTSADASWRLVSPAAVTMGSAIGYLEDRTSSSFVFEYAATSNTFNVGYFGANFQYDLVSDVPEPATLPLSLLGLAMLVAATCARRRAAPRATSE